MKRQVFWKNPKYRPGKSVAGIHECKYLIAGGGITGLTLAHFLIEGGVKPTDIIIVEEGVVGTGSTGRSAGILIPEIETEKNVGWETFLEEYGVKLSKAYRHAHIEAMHTIEKLIKLGKISCDARRGDFLVLARNKEARERVEADMRARRMMGERPAALRGAYLMNEFGSPGFVFAERDLEGLSVNPLALAQGIATYLRRLGVRIFERSPLISTYGTTARFRRGAIEFTHVVLARGVGEEHARLHKYITTIAVTEKLKPKQLQELRLADLDLFIDEEGIHSYHYGKITGDGRLLLGYGDVRTETGSAVHELHAPHLRNVQKFLKTMFPHTKLDVAYAWSGVYAIRKDLIPIVTTHGREMVVNGAGIQLGSIASANYAAAVLLGKSHPLKGLWHPT